MNQTYTLDKPGIYDIPFENYIHQKNLTPTPWLSSSVIFDMLNQSPKHAATYHPDLGAKGIDEPSKVASVGTVAHSIILKTADKRIAVSPFAEFRTNEAKAWRDDALQKGLVVIKEDAYNDAVEMSNAFLPNMSQFYGELGEEFPVDQTEKTVVVQINGVWCKIRLDSIGKSLWDLKSTGTDYNPAKWIKNQLCGQGYLIQVAFYKRVWKELTGEDKRFILAVIEQSAPYDAYPVIVDDVGLELANEQINWALSEWKKGIETGQWRGYSNGRVIYATPPSWEIADWELFKQREKDTHQAIRAEAA